MTNTFNNKVFTVEDTVEDDHWLLIEDNLLDNFKTFDCLGSLRLADEDVRSSWGYTIDRDSRLYSALVSAGLDPSDYRYNSLSDEVKESSLEHVRRLLGVKDDPSTNAEFKFK